MVRIMKKDGNRLEGIGERIAVRLTLLEEALGMTPKDAETVREWLDYGALRGLFQWRNSGKGRFEWKEVAKED